MKAFRTEWHLVLTLDERDALGRFFLRALRDGVPLDYPERVMVEETLIQMGFLTRHGLPTPEGARLAGIDLP